MNGFPNVQQQHQWVREEKRVCGWEELYEETKMLVQKSVGEAKGETSTTRRAHRLKKKGKCIKNKNSNTAHHITY